MKRLNHISHYSDFHLDGFAIILFVLGFHYYWIWALLGLYLYCFRKRIKVTFCACIMIIIFMRYAFFINQNISDEVSQSAQIIHIEKHTYQDTYTLDMGDYHIHYNQPHGSYEVGDHIYIKGHVHAYRKQTIPYGFDQYTYYLSKNIKGYIIASESYKINHEFNVMSYRFRLLDNLDKYQSATWMKSFLCGEDTLAYESKSLFSEVGLLYLLQASGMHIYMLILVIRKIMFYMDLKKHYQQFVICGIYLFFAYMHGFDVGMLRLLLMFLLMIVNDHFELRFTKLELLQFTVIMMLITHIAWIYHVGLLIVYLILTTIYLLEPMLKNVDTLEKRYVLSFSVLLVILPFQGKISILTLLLLPIMSIIITGPFFMLIILSLFYSKIDAFTMFLFDNLEAFVSILHSKNYVIYAPSLSIYLIIIYYLCLIYLFQSQRLIHLAKRFILIILIFLIPIIEIKLSNDIHIYFLDVGQGDAIFVESKDCKILIDAFSHSLDFLQHRGVYQLDYLILTHSDHDHTKEAKEITQKIHVKNILVSAHDQHHQPYFLAPLKIKSNDRLTCGKIDLKFFSPIEDFDNPNDNSLVFKLSVFQTSILFTGDIEAKTEEKLVSYYKHDLKSDVIKVPHHGSDTSSTQAFIEAVQPEFAIISVGMHNRFDFPSLDVIHRYTMIGSKIYRTDTHGTIIYIISQKKTKWSFHLPF